MTLYAFKQLKMKLKLKGSTVFIIFTSSFLERTYILLQNCYINNGITNNLKQKKNKRAQKTILYDKLKERQKLRVNG